jgi:selenocysteine-specific elongation factor
VARLRLEKPLFVFAGDHFIIRDWAQQCTLGGGVVLDPTPNPRTLTPERLGRLQSIAAATEDGDRFVEYELSAMRATQIDQVGLRTRFSSGSVAAAINQLIAQGKIVKLGNWVAEAAWWRKVIRLAVDAIDRDHRQRPERLGLPLSDLKAALAAELPASELFPFLLTALAGEGYIQSGAAIRSSRHAPSLPAGLQAAGVRLRTALSSRNFDPPSRKELAPDSVSQQALRFLIQTGEAVELGEEVVLFADHYNKAAEIIRRHIRDRGPSTASDLRQALGTSRRIVIPLLERMDKEGITRRDGDRRILR